VLTVEEFAPVVDAKAPPVEGRMLVMLRLLKSQ
jgi:hypothetical protein